MESEEAGSTPGRRGVRSGSQAGGRAGAGGAAADRSWAGVRTEITFQQNCDRNFPTENFGNDHQRFGASPGEFDSGTEKSVRNCLDYLRNPVSDTHILRRAAFSFVSAGPRTLIFRSRSPSIGIESRSISFHSIFLGSKYSFRDRLRKEGLTILR